MPALDGVRGVAILLVLACHFSTFLSAAPSWAAGLLGVVGFGWVGVDLFFVLSGCLITGALLDAPRTRAAARAFYARRALRIWPLYLLALALCSALAWGAPDWLPEGAADFRRLAPWLWTHTVNLQLASSAGAYLANPYGVAGFWSLALEEQFYALWPLVALGRAPRVVARWALACWLASILVRAGLSASGWSGERLYVFPLARLDGLAVGAWLACAARQPATWARVRAITRPAADRPAWAVIALLTLYLIVRAVLPFLVTEPVGQAIVLPLIVGTAGALVATVAAHGRGALAAQLSRPWLRGVGVVSYGLYVWHMLALHLLTGAVPLWWPSPHARDVAGALAVPTTALLALASWYGWERPWLRLKRYVPASGPRAS